MDKEQLIGVSKAPETAHNVPVVLHPDFPISTESRSGLLSDRDRDDGLTPSQAARALSSGLPVVSQPVDKA